MELTAAREALAALGRGLSDGPGRVRLDLDGAVARLQLDNPTARRAVTVRMMTELADAVRTLRGWDGGAVVVGSTDPVAFCAGGHLGQVRRAVADPQAARTMARAMTAVLDGLLDLPILSIAAISGLAVGGGAELATACDLRILAPGARIHFVHARLGIAPGWGGAGRLVRLLGRGPALRLLTEASPVDAQAARAIGLADEVAEDPAAAAVARIEAWGHAPEALRAIKRQIVAAERNRPDDAAAAFADVWGGPAHDAALARLRRHTG